MRAQNSIALNYFGLLGNIGILDAEDDDGAVIEF